MDFSAIAIDPGITTGFVIADLKGTTLTVSPQQAKLTPWGFHQFVERYALRVSPRPILICEDFEFRPKSPVGLVMTSAHLIGVTMMLAERLGLTLRMQNAAYAKAGFFNSIPTLKKAGVYVGGKDYEHAMDAMRHFMQWLTYGPGYRFVEGMKLNIRLVK